jgi:hypothetical protein
VLQEDNLRRNPPRRLYLCSLSGVIVSVLIFFAGLALGANIGIRLALYMARKSVRDHECGGKGYVP